MATYWKLVNIVTIYDHNHTRDTEIKLTNLCMQVIYVNATLHSNESVPRPLCVQIVEYMLQRVILFVHTVVNQGWMHLQSR